ARHAGATLCVLRVGTIAGRVAKEVRLRIAIVECPLAGREAARPREAPVVSEATISEAAVSEATVSEATVSEATVGLEGTAVEGGSRFRNGRERVLRGPLHVFVVRHRGEARVALHGRAASRCSPHHERQSGAENGAGKRKASFHVKASNVK